MITVAIIHSNTRIQQITQMIEYLSLHPKYATWQKIILNDGPVCLIQPVGFEIINVPRTDHLYCRANVWKAAVAASSHNTLVMMDGDRLPHFEYFDYLQYLDYNTIMYCKHLWQATEVANLPTHLEFIKSKRNPNSFYVADDRCTIQNGNVPPTKNPMSGCVAFNRHRYKEWGGMSERFKGWGFNDIDCYYRAFVNDCKFISLPLPEVHLYHKRELSYKAFMGMNAYNGVMFYDSWNLPIHDTVHKWLKDLHLSVKTARSMDLIGFCNLSSIQLN
jgi:hypothetical protein